VSAKSTAPAPIVRDNEDPWSAAELTEQTELLRIEEERLAGEFSRLESLLADLIADAGDGSGDDQADAGSKTFEREHEMSLRNNARDLLDQVHRAQRRLASGTYGVCESCGNAIGKARLQAFPRVTLCLTCKQREERV